MLAKSDSACVRTAIQHFDVAPWCASLEVVSVVGKLALVGPSFGLLRAIPHGPDIPLAEPFGTLLLAVPLLTRLVGSLFAVNGYERLVAIALSSLTPPG